MAYSLAEALSVLKRHEPELRQRGVVHAAVFGSVAPGEAIDTSDVDVLIDLDPEKGVGLFEYVDIVNQATLKPRLRSNILCEALGAF